MDAIKRIAELLKDESPRKRIAAAVVLGELRVKDPAVVSTLMQLARDPVEAYAEAALEALGQIGSLKALPALLDAVGRGKEVGRLAGKAIAALGEDALPELRKRLADATPELRATLSQLLPAVHGKQSLGLTLAGMLGQPFDAVNRVTLAFRQEVKSLSDAERKSARQLIEKFLDKRGTREDEPALRGGIKLLGFLSSPDTADTLLSYVSSRQASAVRVEAVTALRFALGGDPTRKVLRRLMELLSDSEPLVVRAARDTLTVLPVGEEFTPELAELAEAEDVDVALWAIARLGQLGGKVSEKALLSVASRADRARAEAAARALLAQPQGPSLVARALGAAQSEESAQVLAETLGPASARLTKKDVQALLAAGRTNLSKKTGIARRQLEPVRAAEPSAWAEALRKAAAGLGKKDPARAESLLALLARSSHGTAEDRFAHACQQLERSALDVHPHARQRDATLGDLCRLAESGFPLGVRLRKEKRLGDEARYYVGFHLAEQQEPHANAAGYELLEALAQGRNKVGKAAKNRLKLLEREG